MEWFLLDTLTEQCIGYGSRKMDALVDIVEDSQIVKLSK